MSALGPRLRYNKARCFETFPFLEETIGLIPTLRERIASLAQQIDDHRKRALGLPLVPAQTPASVGSEQVWAVRADLGGAAGMRPEPSAPDTAPPGPATQRGEATTAPPPSLPTQSDDATPVTQSKDLTLTNLYNVREALRAARPLTDKEKAIHTTGLVGVLHQLHTELDAAVLAAYGWADLAPGLAATPGTPAHTAATAELLQRLVALNARRAAEEAQGTVRWLRPDFQNPTQNASKIGQKQEQTTTEIHAEDAHEADEISAQNHSDTPLPVATQPWPATLPEQVHAVAQALAASPVPLTLEALAARFKGKGPWKKALPTLLQTLHVLGRAQPVQGGEGELWRT